MSDLSHVTIGGETYDLKDAVARTLGTPVNPVRLPLVVEKEGVRYSCDVISDESGTDWDISRTDTPGPATRLPFFATDGERLFKIDIRDDADGIDWNITKIQ